MDGFGLGVLEMGVDGIAMLGSFFLGHGFFI